MVTWRTLPLPDDWRPAMSYRIDISEDDARSVACNVSEATGTMAAHRSGVCPIAKCGEAGNSGATPAKNLTPGKTYYYRVFAMNEFGISPVSIEPTYTFGHPARYVDSFSCAHRMPDGDDVSYGQDRAGLGMRRTIMAARTSSSVLYHRWRPSPDGTFSTLAALRGRKVRIVRPLPPM